MQKRGSVIRNLLNLLVIFALVIMAGGCGTRNEEIGGENQPPVSPHPPTEKQQVVLYFSDDEAMYLVPELREVQYAKDNLPQIIVEELVKGPQTAELRPVLPETTKVLSLEVWGGTAYVNLSKEFERDYPGGTCGEGMALGSMVQSLTELENVRKVQFLIEGKKVEVLDKGHADLSQPFYRDLRLGNVELNSNELEKEQQEADQGKRAWRLDPLATARKEGPLHRLYVNGEYNLISQKTGEYSGTGEATVFHTFGGATYEVELIQPVKTGAGGIWVINSILPVGTKDEAITSFLENQYWQPILGGKTCSAYEILGEKKYEERTVVYIWVYCSEYTEKGLEEKSGVISEPLALTIYSADEGHQAVIDMRAPEDGAYYESSIKRIFPSEVQKKILGKSKDIGALKEQARKKAADFYQKKEQ